MEQHNRVVEENKTLTNRVEKLEARSTATDVREAMRCLEKWVALDIVKSKNKVKDGLYTIKLLLGDTLYRNQVSSKLSLSEQKWLEYYKKNGDFRTLGLTADSMKALMIDKDDTKEQKATKCSLVDKLAAYCAKEGVDFCFNPLESAVKVRLYTQISHG